MRHWVAHGLLQCPVPLTGARALASDALQDRTGWVVCFLEALATEAGDTHQLLRTLEHGWQAARSRIVGRRRTSRAGLAVDVLAAAPLLSATTLARAVGISIKSATTLLDTFVQQGIAVEVTHRGKRRLFGLVGLAPLRDQMEAPRRPLPGRRPGRPRLAVEAAEPPPVSSALPPAPLSRFEHPPIDYAALEAAMAACDQAVATARRTLASLTNKTR